MSYAYDEIERVARDLADSRFGAGHFDAKGTKRSYWRRKAVRILDAHAATLRSFPKTAALLGALGRK